MMEEGGRERKKWWMEEGREGESSDGEKGYNPVISLRHKWFKKPVPYRVAVVLRSLTHISQLTNWPGQSPIRPCYVLVHVARQYCTSWVDLCTHLYCVHCTASAE